MTLGVTLMSDTIFEYKLNNAWDFPLMSLSIHDSAEDNVKCIVWYATNAPEDLPINSNYTLEISAIEEIKEIIRSNPSLFEIEEVESPWVLDGFINEFQFSNGKMTVEIKAYNLSAFRKNPLTIDGNKPVNAKLLIKVYDRIKKILVSHGVDKRYMRLGIDTEIF